MQYLNQMLKNIFNNAEPNQKEVREGILINIVLLSYKVYTVWHKCKRQIVHAKIMKEVHMNENGFGTTYFPRHSHLFFLSSIPLLLPLCTCNEAGDRRKRKSDKTLDIHFNINTLTAFCYLIYKSQIQHICRLNLICFISCIR